MAVRPVYLRILRVHHLRLGPWTTLVLFEGSVLLTCVLALAEVVAGWATVALPIAVAAMVKFNDVIAGLLAGVAKPVQVPARRTGWPTAMGRSLVRSAYPSSSSTRSTGTVARGVASVPIRPQQPGEPRAGEPPASEQR